MAMQQLDKNMSSLRSWLAHIETELSRPIVYDTCDDKEIQRKLSQQQASGSGSATPPEIKRNGFNVMLNVRDIQCSPQFQRMQMKESRNL